MHHHSVNLLYMDGRLKMLFACYVYSYEIVFLVVVFVESSEEAFVVIFRE